MAAATVCHVARAAPGWALSETEHDGIKVTHRVFAPPGRGAAVIDEVNVSNTSNAARSFSLYEYWDVARRDIVINWLVSGIPFANLPTDAAAARDALNQNFDEATSYDAKQQALILRRHLAAGVTRPDPDTPDEADWYPGDPYLAISDRPIRRVSRFMGSSLPRVCECSRPRRTSRVGWRQR